MSGSPLDKAVGRTSPQETGDSPLGGEVFQKDLHNTPTVLWVSVALMCLGFAVVGVGAVVLSHAVGAGWALITTGAVVGLIGAVVGLTNGIMNNVD